jgi:hypothetical protein
LRPVKPCLNSARTQSYAARRYRHPDRRFRGKGIGARHRARVGPLTSSDDVALRRCCGEFLFCNGEFLPCNGQFGIRNSRRAACEGLDFSVTFRAVRRYILGYVTGGYQNDRAYESPADVSRKKSGRKQQFRTPSVGDTLPSNQVETDP